MPNRPDIRARYLCRPSLAAALVLLAAGPAMTGAGTVPAGAEERSLHPASAQQITAGDEAWADGFYSNGMNARVSAFTVWNNQLVAGGSFTIAGGTFANRVAIYNGEGWLPLGAGMNGQVLALAVYRGNLYAGGSFTTADGQPASNLAMWDGNAWLEVGNGTSNTVRALAVWEDELIVGGDFNEVGGTLSADHVATWNESDWDNLGGGMDNSVRALALAAGGLFAGGDFTMADGNNAAHVAAWNGQAWTALDGGVDNTVHALTEWSGRLIVGGDFTSADGGGVPSVRIATWDGAWDVLGGTTGIDNSVRSLGVFQSLLMIGGFFIAAEGQPMSRITSWNGSNFNNLDSGMGDAVHAMQVYNNGLFVGGDFLTAGPVGAMRVAEWDGSLWSPLLGNGMDDVVHALGTYAGDLVAGGLFMLAGGTPAARLAHWDGAQWSPFGSGLTHSSLTPAVNAVIEFAGNLIVAGTFDAAGGTPANNIARWDGAAWVPLDSGVNGTVHALEAHDGRVIVGGAFSVAGGIAVNNLAAWNFGWSDFHLGATGTAVRALKSTGLRLLVGGSFTQLGASVPASNIAEWTGSAWNAFGTGADGDVRAFEVYQSECVAGGAFSSIDGTPALRIAVLSGGEWQPLSGGINTGSSVDALAVFEAELIACGTFTEAGGVGANNIASWDGGNWGVLGSGLNGPGFSLQPHGTDLFVGGDFTQAGDKVSNCIGLREGTGTVSVPVIAPAPTLDLAAPVPNPSQHGTRLDFVLAQQTHVSLAIYDVEGRRVRTLVRGLLPAGANSITWNGRDARGRRVPAGLYVARFDAGGTKLTQKILRMR